MSILNIGCFIFDKGIFAGPEPAFCSTIVFLQLHGVGENGSGLGTAIDAWRISATASLENDGAEE